MAIFLVSANVGFLATEFGDQAAGYALPEGGLGVPFAMLMQALALVLLGGGVYSVDYCIWGRGRTAQPATAARPAGSQSADRSGPGRPSATATTPGT
jgi:hypothetical protein